MLKKLMWLVAMIFVFPMAGSVYAVDRDAEIAAFADEAIAHVKKVGRDQAYKDFADRKGRFIKGEVYVVILALDGVCTFQPMNPRLMGKNFKGLRDSSGKLFVQEIMNNINKDGFTWVEYNWVNPKTKKIGKKRAIAKMIDNNEYVLIGYWP